METTQHPNVLNPPEPKRTRAVNPNPTPANGEYGMYVNSTNLAMDHPQISNPRPFQSSQGQIPYHNNYVDPQQQNMYQPISHSGYPHTSMQQRAPMPHNQTMSSYYWQMLQNKPGGMYAQHHGQQNFRYPSTQGPPVVDITKTPIGGGSYPVTHSPYQGTPGHMQQQQHVPPGSHPPIASSQPQQLQLTNAVGGVSGGGGPLDASYSQSRSTSVAGMQFSIAPAQQQHQPQHTQNNIQQQQLSESFGQNSSASQPIMVSVTTNDIASNDTSNLSATHMQSQQQSVAVVSTSGSLSSTSSFPGSVPPVANSGDPSKMVQTTPLLVRSPAQNGESLPQPSKPLTEDTTSSGLPSASSSGQGNSVEGHDQQKTRLILQQLVLLLHANRCLQRERENPAHTCNLQYCRTMKDVLRHMMHCQDAHNCSYNHCVSSRQIIMHWNRCKSPNCSVCIPVKKVIKPSSVNGHLNEHPMPLENAEAEETYRIMLDAFREGGAVEVHIGKCVTMGPPEAGKTQLKRALFGHFTIAEESTPACTKATPAVEIMLAGESKWKPFECEHLKTLSLQEDIVNNSPTDTTNTATIPSPDNSSDSISVVAAVKDQPSTQSTSGNTTNRSNSSESSLTIERQRSMKNFQSLNEHVTKCLVKSKCSDKNLKSMKLIYMVDSGGQPSFLDFHPVTATFAASYLLVYNMKEGLDAKPRMSYRKSNNFSTKKLPPSTKTNLEILHRSMLTVHHFQARFDERHRKISELMKDKFRAAPSAPPLFIVGTRKVQSSTSSHSKKVKPLYQNIPSLKRATSLKFVESTSPNCEGTKELRDAISNEDSLCSFRLPLSWLKLHLMSVVLESNPEKERFKKELQVQTYSNLCQMCLNENIVRSTEEFKAMITVFHSLGVFSCPDLEFKETQDQIEEYLIFLNPNILYGFVSKMLEIPFIDLDKWRNRSSLKDLQLAGELTVTALEDLDIPDKIGTCDGIHRRLLSWLVHWGLAAPMDAEGKLFIPSVLPLQPDLPSPFRGTPFDPFPLQFCFIYDSTKNYTFHYLPRGFFPHFVVTLVKGGYTLHENALDPEDDEIVPRCRDAISLIRQRQKFDGAKNTFNIQLVDKGTHISIHMFPADLKAKDTRREAGRVLADLKKKIEDTNEKLYYRSHDEIALCCDCTCRSEQRILDCHLARIDVGNGDDGIPITCLHPKRACNLAWENNLTDDLLRAVIETFHQISGQFVSRSAADNMPSASTSVVNSMPTMDTSVQQFSSKRGQRTPDSPVEPAKRLRRSGAPSDEWDLAPTYRQMEQDTFCTRRSSGKLKHLQEQSSEHNVSQDSSLDPDLAIKSTTDLLPYLDNMKTQLKLLGCSLGIQSETAAIEKTSEDSTTKCLQILEHWLKVNANPSWSLLCSKLKGCESFNNVREQMEKDHFQ